MSDNTTRHVQKVLDGFAEKDKQEAELQEAVDAGETPEFDTADYVRHLRERGTIPNE